MEIGNRSEQMELGPNKWKSNRTNGNPSEQMEIGPNRWKSNRTDGNRSEQMEIDPNKWKSIRTNGNRSEQKMEIDPNIIDGMTVPTDMLVTTAKYSSWWLLR